MVAPANGFYFTKSRGLNQVRIAYVLNKESLNKSIDCLEEALDYTLISFNARDIFLIFKLV